jgi:hypothetical protein
VNNSRKSVPSRYQSEKNSSEQSSSKKKRK